MAFAADDSLPELKLGSRLNKNTDIFSVTDIFLTLIFLPRPDDLCQISLTGGHWLPCSGPLSTECTMEQQCTVGKQVRITIRQSRKHVVKSAVKTTTRQLCINIMNIVQVVINRKRQEPRLPRIHLLAAGHWWPSVQWRPVLGIQWTPASSAWAAREKRRDTEQKTGGMEIPGMKSSRGWNDLRRRSFW